MQLGERQRWGKQHNTTQHNTTQHNTTQHNTTQHNTTQHNTTQHNTTQHSTAQHSTAQHSTAQHSTAQHSTAQHSTAQHSTAQHSTALHNTTQHYTTRHDTTRHDTTRHDTTRHDTTRRDATRRDATLHTTPHHTTPHHTTPHHTTPHHTTPHHTTPHHTLSTPQLYPRAGCRVRSPGRQGRGTANRQCTNSVGCVHAPVPSTIPGDPAAPSTGRLGPGSGQRPLVRTADLASPSSPFLHARPHTGPSAKPGHAPPPRSCVCPPNRRTRICPNAPSHQPRPTPLPYRRRGHWHDGPPAEGRSRRRHGQVCARQAGMQGTRGRPGKEVYRYPSRIGKGQREGGFLHPLLPCSDRRTPVQPTVSPQAPPPPATPCYLPCLMPPPPPPPSAHAPLAGWQRPSGAPPGPRIGGRPRNRQRLGAPTRGLQSGVFMADVQVCG